MGYFGDNRDRYTPKSHGWTAGGTEWAKADMHRGYVPSHYSKPTKFGPFTVGDRFKTNQEMKEQEHGVTLRHEATPGNIAKGNTYKEGVGKGRGKIAGSTVHGVVTLRCVISIRQRFLMSCGRIGLGKIILILL